MKKILSLIMILGTWMPLTARDRIFISTDRNTYIAGDLVYCSLFAVNEEGRMSDFSAVSYLELISADGTVVEAKVGLFDGRGAGSFRIPVTAPTGNYSLVAYTSDSQPVPEGTRLLSIFNTNANARVKGGISLIPEGQYTPSFAADEPPQGGLSLTLPGHLRQGREATLVLGELDQDADVSLTIYHDDGLAPSDGKTLSAFLHGQAAAPGNRQGEYEGEIVYATVEGLGNADSILENQATAFLSSAGAPSNVYVGRNTPDGRLQFITGNIYGDRELVCEVVSMDGKECHINLTSPFIHPDPGAIPELSLSSAQRNALVARKAALRAQISVKEDTLLRFLPKREDLLLKGQPFKRYHLDDYNRFPTVREICVEFVRELQFVRRDGRWQLRLITSDATDSRKYLQENVLAMMDGVVLTDQGILADFDAMLLEDIDIYSQSIVMGGIPFNGVVNFVSKKNYVTALHFPTNVRVVDFKGVSYPLAYPGGAPEGSQDLRQVLYWHPALELKGGNQTRVHIKTPSYSGRFQVVAEGWKADGTPLRATYSFEVE